MTRTLRFLCLLLTALGLFSCSVPQLSYFQGTEDGDILDLSGSEVIRLKPEDRISIIVNSKTPELAQLFNLPVYSKGITASGAINTGYSVSSYTIAQDGTIDFPVLGKIQAAGLTRQEIAANIKDDLIGRNLINDAIVTVEFVDMSFSILGEVNRPGRYNIDRDNLTLLQAIGMAGDLTINGLRENILVQRTVDGKMINYRLDLTDLDELVKSPAYSIQQNDVIYVTPNDRKMRESTVNGNNVVSTSFWISLSSLAVTIANLIVNSIN